MSDRCASIKTDPGLNRPGLCKCGYWRNTVLAPLKHAKNEKEHERANDSRHEAADTPTERERTTANEREDQATDEGADNANDDIAQPTLASIIARDHTGDPASERSENDPGDDAEAAIYVHCMPSHPCLPDSPAIF